MHIVNYPKNSFTTFSFLRSRITSPSTSSSTLLGVIKNILSIGVLKIFVGFYNPFYIRSKSKILYLLVQVFMYDFSTLKALYVFPFPR